MSLVPYAVSSQINDPSTNWLAGINNYVQQAQQIVRAGIQDASQIEALNILGNETANVPQGYIAVPNPAYQFYNGTNPTQTGQFVMLGIAVLALFLIIKH